MSVPSFPDIDIALLRSNIIPSLTEKIHTQKLLGEEKDHLKQYDEELNRLKKIVRKLRKERDAFEAQIWKRQSWITGIRRLPVGILLEIFSRVVFSESDALLTITQVCTPAHGSSKLVKSAVCSPLLTLTHVSHYWRKMAVSCLRLWSLISVNVACPRSEFGDILSLYIGNSVNHPLDIEIHGSGKFHPGNLKYWGEHGVAVAGFPASLIQLTRPPHFNTHCCDLGPHRRHLASLAISAGNSILMHNDHSPSLSNQC
ncbi:hypothetical protein L218DRAFT_665049 [Marasmius fiardii PR-910]|nr:hypothetical protein L218DRAFT_665049 [Marasmius fiardii PR-910]